MDWSFVSGSWWKSWVLSHLTTAFKIFGLHLFSPQQTSFLENFWSDLRFFGTVSNFHSFMIKFICQCASRCFFFHVYLSYCHIFMCKWQCRQQEPSLSPQFHKLLVTRWAGYLLLSTSPLPSESPLNMVDVDRISCPYISCNNLKVCVVAFFSFTRNLVFLFSARFFFFSQYGRTKSSMKILLPHTLPTSQSMFQHVTGGMVQWSLCVHS